MEVLSQYTFWQLVAIIGAISVVIRGLYDVAVWILDKMNIYHSNKTKQEIIDKAIKEHSENIVELNDKLNKTVEGITTYCNIEKIMLRHSVIRACEDYLHKGFIYSYELESIEDMFTIYREIGGNSYVCSMMEKVRNLPVKYTDKGE